MKHPTKRYYETVGFVISGSAKLEIEGQMLSLKSGDSWLVLPEPSINTPFSNLSGLLRRPRRQPRFMAAMSPSDTNYSVAEPHEPRTQELLRTSVRKECAMQPVKAICALCEAIISRG